MRVAVSLMLLGAALAVLAQFDTERIGSMFQGNGVGDVKFSKGITPDQIENESFGQDLHPYPDQRQAWGDTVSIEILKATTDMWDLNRIFQEMGNDVSVTATLSKDNAEGVVLFVKLPTNSTTLSEQEDRRSFGESIYSTYMYLWAPVFGTIDEAFPTIMRITLLTAGVNCLAALYNLSSAGSIMLFHVCVCNLMHGKYFYCMVQGYFVNAVCKSICEYLCTPTQDRESLYRCILRGLGECFLEMTGRGRRRQ